MTKNLTVKKSHILPWENADEFETLVADLLDEYEPQGPAERHLVEEIAGIIWRKQRVGVAEVALHHHGLLGTCSDHSRTGERAMAQNGGLAAKIGVGEAVRLSDEELDERRKDADEDLKMSEDARKLATSGKYDAAVKALRDDTRDWWKDILEEGEDGLGFERKATAESLVEWLNLEVLPYIRNVTASTKQAPAIRAQAQGESLNPQKFNELAKWEAHLDRRLEGAISLLMKLRNTRKVSKAV
tara:strand:+ start:159 stop:887 length:729 start_codon:yes stop_codon:yes gene_type:complete